MNSSRSNNNYYSKSSIRYRLLRGQHELVGHWELDLWSNELSWDPNLYKIFNCEDRQHISPNILWNEIVSLKDVNRIKREIKDVINCKADYHTGFRIRINNKKRFFQGSAEIIFSKNNQPLRLIGIVKDVTARANNRESLIQLLKDRELLLENISYGYFCTDLQGVIINCNHIVSKLFNLPADSIIGENVQEIAVDPDFYNLINTASQFYKDKILTVETGECYISKIKKCLEFSIYRRVDLLEVYVKDITADKAKEYELHRTKERQKYVINSTQDYIWAVCEKGELIMANDSYCKEVSKILGIEFNPKINQVNYLKRLPRKAQAKWIKALKKAFNGERVRIEFVDYCEKDDRENFYEVSFNPIIKKSGKRETIEGVACFSRDITSKITQVRELKARNNSLKRIRWLQSHVIRAPLTNILALVDLLQLEKDGAQNTTDQENILEQVNSECLKLDVIIKEICSVSEKNQ